MYIGAKNFKEAWKKALQHILDNGADFKDKDSRICKEALNLTVSVDDITDFESPMDTMQEFEWVYPSKEELSAIILNKEELSGYEFSYGPRIFNFNGKDQINDFLVPLLKKDPESRRAVISLFNPPQDSSVLSKNVPGLMFISFRVRNGRLNMTCFIRSNDYFIGWPSNVYQLVILQKYISEKLGISAGNFTTVSCSAHLFHEHFEMITRVLSKN